MRKFFIAVIMALELLLGAVSEAATLRIIAFGGPPKYEESFEVFAGKIVSTIAVNGTFPEGERLSPTDARLLRYVVPEGLMTTPLASSPFHRGIFFPAHPWESAHGELVWVAVDLTAGEGEMVSLSQVKMTWHSSDPSDILGGKVDFGDGSFTYSDLAPGFLPNGTRVTSGPATQPVVRVIVMVGLTSFSVSSPKGVQDVRNFVNRFIRWLMEVTATAGATTVATVLPRQPPALSGILSSDGSFLVTAEPNGDPTRYPLQKTSAIGSGAVWSDAGSIMAGQTVNLGPVLGRPSLFVRHSP